MKKLFFVIACLLLLWPPEAKSQPLQITSGYFVENDCDGINNRAPGVVMCIQLQNSSGRTPGEYRWTGTAWQRSDGFYVGTVAPTTCKVSEIFFKTDATPGENIYGCTAEPGTWTLQAGGVGTGGHVFHNEGGAALPQRTDADCVGGGITCADVAGKTEINVPGVVFHEEGGAALTQRTDINCVGAGITCADVGGQTEISVAAGAESDPIVGAITGVPKGNGAGVISAANATDLPYTPAGTIAATNVGAAIGELDSEKQPGSANLTALSSGSGGFWTVATNVARSFANGTGITWVNPAGVAGNPQANVTSSVVMTDRSSTWTTGDVNLRLASSFSLPNATGAAPTTPATCAFDLTSQTYKCGLTNGSTVTLATTGLLSGYQPLSANGTAFSALTGAAAKIPYWTAAGAMDVSQIPLCINSGGNVLHVSSQAPLTFTCDASGSALSGATNNYGLFATGATTFASSDALQLDGSSNVWAKNGLVVGDPSINSWDPDTQLITGHKAWTIQNIAGIPLVATTEGGAITDTNVAVFKTTGGVTRIVNGGAAGSGTWTDTSTSVGSNKTLDDTTSTLKLFKSVQVELFGPTTDTASGNGQYYFRVPVSLNGTNLVGIQTNTVTAGTTGLTSVQVSRCSAVATSPLCSGTVDSMLSVVVSIDSGETSSSTAATAVTIDTTKDDVATGQILRFDLTAINTTPAKGLIVNLDFKTP